MAYFRLLIPALICAVVFFNHYCRDTVGALEKQIESDLHLSTDNYSTLNSLFFLPNVIAPLFVSYLCQLIGKPSHVYVIAVVLSFVGYVLFATGGAKDSLWLLYVGRFIAGIVYEFQDCIPVIMLRPLFAAEWGVVCGILNAILRCGSVLSFLLNPVMYQTYGVVAALWLNALFALLAIGCILGACWAENKVEVVVNMDAEISADTDAHAHVQIHTEDCYPAHTAESSTPQADEEEEDRVAIELISTAGVPGNGSSSSGNGDSSATATSPWMQHTYMATLLRYYPLHEYSFMLYYYLLAAIFVYGAMVPFWFVGSKFLQVNYVLSVGTADSYMQLPEGMMVVVSPLLGRYLDKHGSSVEAKLRWFSVSCLTLGISYIMLMYGFVPASGDTTSAASPQILLPPAISMLGIGLSYAFSNCLIWNAIIDVVPSSQMASVAGLLGCGLNILPAVLPLLINAVSGHYDATGNSPLLMAELSRRGLWILMFSSACAACFAILASWSVITDAGSSVSCAANSDKSSVTRPESGRGGYSAVANPMSEYARDDRGEDGISV